MNVVDSGDVGVTVATVEAYTFPDVRISFPHAQAVVGIAIVGVEDRGSVQPQADRAHTEGSFGGGSTGGSVELGGAILSRWYVWVRSPGWACLL
jgi:hypothetical protein